MQLIEGQVVYSASDLVSAAECEFAVARRLDEVLGRAPRADLPEDALMERAAAFGDAHEARVVAQFVAEYGQSATGVVHVPRPDSRDLTALRAGQDATLAAVRAGAAVVTQAVFFDGLLLGYADFLIRQPDGRYAIADAKLARRAKVRALLQIAAYHDLAGAAGIEVADVGFLLLGDGTRTEHYLPDVVPVVRERLAHLDALFSARRAAHTPLAWGDPDVTACGRCAVCQAEVAAARDVLLVAGLRMTQRTRLSAAGITTIDQLAQHTHPVDGIAGATLMTLRAQARLQVHQLDATAAALEAAGAPDGDPVVPEVLFEVFDATPLVGIPAPSPGDIYFDFEGDPLWQDTVGRFGLEYLFGVVEAPIGGRDPVFRAFWAHDRAQEKQALVDFLDYVAARRMRWPDMHIYHYADYERAALLRLAGMHGVGEDAVDGLLRGQVLVDLYPIVKRSVRVSQPSYSLKKLEPLYMGPDLRTGEVTTAGDSVVAYAQYCDARDTGQSDAAAQMLADISDYNAYDCRSTLGLRTWLAARATEHGITPPAPQGIAVAGAAGAEADEAPSTHPLIGWADTGSPAGRTPDQDAAALVGAAVGYHRREEKPFWWAHFERLTVHLDDMTDRDSMVVQGARVLEDWHVPPGRARNLRRVLELVGDLPTGSSLERDTSLYLLYDVPHPDSLSDGGPGTRGWSSATRDGVSGTDGRGRGILRVTESVGKDQPTYAELPTAVAPSPGPRAGSVHDSLVEVADRVGPALVRCAPGSEEANAALPSPARDLLLRRAPRLLGAPGLPPVAGGDFTEAILRAVLALDGSTLAVQGPPGTGKTYVGSHVIARLVVEHRWRIGVVSQSHAVVNHLLDQVVAAGVPAQRVGKKQRPSAASWTEVADTKYAAFLDEHAESGCVLGGTAWDFTNTKRVGRGQLDLLVVDEAGQYSIANTLAVSVSARRLLLLGDPQQLPQVSQGSHPEPVDHSALGWLSDGQTLRPEFGYFLDRSWRMHPELTAKVSQHSYEGRLESRLPETTDRALRDASGTRIAPGVHTQVVAHSGNSVASQEEADRVRALVLEALGWRWTGHAGATPRPMGPPDILVVAPYNAQVALIRRTLDAAGLGEVRVGTVDKFQGQEAPVAIVSMTASAPADVPRGMDFLLSPNRVNVAVSRAQWRAVVVRSAALTDFLPTSLTGLADLGRFLKLVQ